ncbi:MAG: M81 family metallopeptidase [Ilumatobacteraceae bacterium]
MKFAVAGLMHETNTYAVPVSGYTTRKDFTIRHGEELLKYSGMNTYIGGIIDECLRRGIEIVPLMSAIAGPSGTIESEVYEEFKNEILRGLRDNPDIDALVMELHGAGVAEGVDDLEGDLIAAIREVTGPELPITAALDLHGNLSQTMADKFTAILGNHLYPHTDSGERGAEAVAVAADVAAGNIAPVSEIVSLPMLLQPSTTDPGHPAAEMNEVCRAVESRAGIVDCTVFHGFPYSDTPHSGVHVICTADGDRGLARSTAMEVAEWIWSSREQFVQESHSPDSAMRTAAALVGEGETPVVINDTSDNPGGGTPGDGTHLLGAMLEHQIPGSAFAMLCDPRAVEDAIKTGVGNSCELTIGGAHGPLHGPPLKVTARVRTIADGRFVLTHMMRGYPMNVGPSVGIKVGEVDVILTSKPQQTFDSEIFKLHGIDTSVCSVIGLKSSAHFRAGFNHIAAKILCADSPGLTTLNVNTFDHTRHDGPLWPTDPDTEWEPT